jgi:hypothetical protein
MLFVHNVATPSVPQLTVRNDSRVFGGNGFAPSVTPYNGRSEFAKPGPPTGPALTKLAPPGAAGIGPLQP